MSRAKLALVPAICALAFAFGAPAMALNPQPLPPGLKRPPAFQASRMQAYLANGHHFQKSISSRITR